MPDDAAPIDDTGRNEVDGMRLVPDSAQGAVIEPWATRLKPPHPRHISIAAGALITITVSLEQAYMVAYTLADAGLLHQDTVGPFRVGGHWGVTVVHDPEGGEKTGTLVATAQKLEWAQQIVDALNTHQQVISENDRLRAQVQVLGNALQRTAYADKDAAQREATEHPPRCGEGPDGHICGEPVPEGVCSEHGEVGPATPTEPACTSTYRDGAHTCALPPGHTEYTHRTTPDDGGYVQAWSDNISDQALAKMDPDAQKLARILSRFTDAPATPTEPRDTDGLEYVRGYYKVPARIGVRVLFEGQPGVITGSSGPHLLVHMDGAAEPVPAHPTWEMQYLTAEVVVDQAGGEQP
jgi:hypothetical protein